MAEQWPRLLRSTQYRIQMRPNGGGLAQPDAKFLSDVVGEVFTYFSSSAAATRKLWGSRNVDMYLMRVLYIHCLHGSEVYYVSFT